MLISIISFIFVFIVVVLTHELGHFIWAKRAGIRVLELGIGFGPKLLCIERNNTVYSINLIPILAFVRLAGIDEEGEDEKKCPVSEKYFSKSPLQKFKAISAGPIANICLGFLIFSALALFVGLPQISAEISTVLNNSPAQKAGLKPGDIIVEFQGKKVTNILDAIATIHKSAGQSISLSVMRNNKLIYIEAVPKYDKKSKVGLLGFSLKPVYKKYSPLSAIWAGIEKTITITVFIIIVFGQLLIGRVSLADLAGPIGIAEFSGQAASQGVFALAFFIAFISINLGVLNLLPIPALDGGRLVFVLIEWIRRKAIDINTENKIHQCGLIALLALIAIVSINDVLRIISGK